jgi:hypothetical protein
MPFGFPPESAFTFTGIPTVVPVDRNHDAAGGFDRQMTCKRAQPKKDVLISPQAFQSAFYESSRISEAPESA